MNSTPETPKDSAAPDMSIAQIAQELAELRRRYNSLAVASRDCRDTVDQLLRADVLETAKRMALESLVCRLAAKVEGTELTEIQTELKRTFEAVYEQAILRFGDDSPETAELLDVRPIEERGQAEG